MDVKDTSIESLERNDECGSCYNTADNLLKLCSHVQWKAELTGNEPGCLAEEIFKLSVEATDLFLLVTYSKMRAERDKMRTDFLHS